MWARLNDNDTIAQLYMRPVGITLDGVQYPASIFSLWSASELQALKVWSVTMTNSPSNENITIILVQYMLSLKIQMIT